MCRIAESKATLQLLKQAVERPAEPCVRCVIVQVFCTLFARILVHVSIVVSCTPPFLVKRLKQEEEASSRTEPDEAVLVQSEAGARDVLLRGNRRHLVPEAAAHATCQQKSTAITESLISHQLIIHHR